MHGPKFSSIFAAMLVSAMNKEESRTAVITAALQMFLTNGVDSVRMDDIASKLSISKRTLYEMFSSKENLLLECFDLHTARMHERISEEMSKGSDVLSVTLKYLEWMIDESKKADCVFISNLDKYPQFKAKMDSQMEAIYSNLRDNIRLGIEQGVFRNDICVEVVLKAFIAMGRLISHERIAGTAPFDTLVNSTVIVLFRGIATRKGMEKLDEYRFKFNNR